MPARDHPFVNQPFHQHRSGSHHRRASSGFDVIDPEVQATVLRSSPSRSVPKSFSRQKLYHSQSESTYASSSIGNPSVSAEDHRGRISEPSLKFLTLPGVGDDDEVPESDDYGAPAGLGVGGGIGSTSNSIQASPHTTHSYRLRQTSANVPIPLSRTTSSSMVSSSQQRHHRPPDLGYGTIPNTPRGSRSILNSRVSSTERSQPKTAHPTLGLFQTDNHGMSQQRAFTDGYLTRRPSRQDMFGMSSPSSEVFGSLRRHKSGTIRSTRSYDEDILQDGVKGDDRETNDQLAPPTANGIRIWYSSYVTIDWLHDQIKDSVRRGGFRKGKQSFRGIMRQIWERLAGWVIVTLIGVITALIAYCITKTETTLFDFKNGYCSNDLLSPKKECCPGGAKDHRLADESCEAWTTWEAVFAGRRISDGVRLEFVVYLGIALALAVLSSTMTVYMTSSADHDQAAAFSVPGGRKDDMSKRSGEEEPLVRSEPAQAKKKVMYFAAGSGIPEVKTILSGFVIHGYLGISTLIVKCVGLALSVASGLSLGKEGPVVHIAAAVGNILCRQFPKFERNEGKKREILSAACASGVSVAFGAPIGGVLFSLEEVSYYFPPKVMWRAFFSAAVAALTLRVLNPYSNGRLVLLETHYTQDYHTNVIYGAAIILGIFGGLYGAYFSKLNIMYSKRIRQGTWLAIHPIIEVAMVVTITSILSYPSKWGRMGGVEYVAQLFSECTPTSTSKLCDSTPAVAWKVVRELTAVMALRAGLTVITFGIKLPAGIFIPSLAAGAAFGRIFGISMQQLLPQYASLVTPGVWALIGAAATLAGVTRTTVSLVVIILELTGDMAYTVPTAIAVLIAKAVADAIEDEGIYDLVIRMNQFPYLNAKKQHIFGNYRVADMVDTTLPILKIDEDHTVSQLDEKLNELLRLDNIDGSLPCVFAYEVDDDLALGVMGLLSVNDLRHALDAIGDQPEASCNLVPHEGELDHRQARTSIYSFAESEHEDPYDLVPFIDQAPLTISIDSPLELVQQLFVRMGARTIVVTDRKGRYRGLILKKQWLKFLEELDAETE